MIIVDDKLSLDALAGRLQVSTSVVTTWSFHFRLLRALREDRWGRLSSAAEVAYGVVADPPPDLLGVLDPRSVTDLAARLASRHRLNLLAAELIASAVHHRAAVRLRPSNVGRDWPRVMEAEKVRWEVSA